MADIGRGKKRCVNCQMVIPIALHRCNGCGYKPEKNVMKKLAMASKFVALFDNVDEAKEFFAGLLNVLDPPVAMGVQTKVKED